MRRTAFPVDYTCRCSIYCRKFHDSVGLRERDIYISAQPRRYKRNMIIRGEHPIESATMRYSPLHPSLSLSLFLRFHTLLIKTVNLFFVSLFAWSARAAQIRSAMRSDFHGASPRSRFLALAESDGIVEISVPRARHADQTGSG